MRTQSLLLLMCFGCLVLMQHFHAQCVQLHALFRRQKKKQWWYEHFFSLSLSSFSLLTRWFSYVMVCLYLYHCFVLSVLIRFLVAFFIRFDLFSNGSMVRAVSVRRTSSRFWIGCFLFFFSYFSCLFLFVSKNTIKRCDYMWQCNGNKAQNIYTHSCTQRIKWSPASDCWFRRVTHTLVPVNSMKC